MKRRNIVILLLIVVAIVSFGIIDRLVLPRMAQNEQLYNEKQQDPLTHDLESIIQYKNKYMGNAGNIINLFYSLPLNNIERTYQLTPENFSIEVNYKEMVLSAAVLSTGENRLNQSLIYNATAAFALIENLESISFNFIGTSFEVSRVDVEDWYGVKASALAEKGTWEKQVQRNLQDYEYVSKCMDAIIK